MLKTLPFALGTVLYLQAVRAEEKPLSFCRKAGCESKNCPVSIATAGTGYPKCVVYDSEDIFPNQGFPTSEGGPWSPFADVKEPNDGCSIIVKSPADTDEVGCGKTIGVFKHEACQKLDIKKSFMVTYCCGSDCEKAEQGPHRRSAKFRGLESRESGNGGGGGVYLKYPNGTIIPPKTEAPMKVASLDSDTVKRAASEALVARKDKGKCKNWKPDSDMKKDPYTKPSDSWALVHRGAPPETTITITETRSQSWTHGSDISLSVADVLGFGTSISESFTEEKSDSTSDTYKTPVGQEGDVAFTATMKCTRGTGKCDGKDFKGEICEPFVENGKLRGEYTVVVHS